MDPSLQPQFPQMDPAMMMMLMQNQAFMNAGGQQGNPYQQAGGPFGFSLAGAAMSGIGSPGASGMQAPQMLFGGDSMASMVGGMAATWFAKKTIDQIIPGAGKLMDVLPLQGMGEGQSLLSFMKSRERFDMTQHITSTDAFNAMDPAQTYFSKEQRGKITGMLGGFLSGNEWSQAFGSTMGRIAPKSFEGDIDAQGKQSLAFSVAMADVFGNPSGGAYSLDRSKARGYKLGDLITATAEARDGGIFGMTTADIREMAEAGKTGRAVSGDVNERMLGAADVLRTGEQLMGAKGMGQIKAKMTEIFGSSSMTTAGESVDLMTKLDNMSIALDMDKKVMEKYYANIRKIGASMGMTGSQSNAFAQNFIMDVENTYRNLSNLGMAGVDKDKLAEDKMDLITRAGGSTATKHGIVAENIIREMAATGGGSRTIDVGGRKMSISSAVGRLDQIKEALNNKDLTPGQKAEYARELKAITAAVSGDATLSAEFGNRVTNYSEKDELSNQTMFGGGTIAAANAKGATGLISDVRDDVKERLRAAGLNEGLMDKVLATGIFAQDPDNAKITLNNKDKMTNDMRRAYTIMKNMRTGSTRTGSTEVFAGMTEVGGNSNIQGDVEGLKIQSDIMKGIMPEGTPGGGLMGVLERAMGAINSGKSPADVLAEATGLGNAEGVAQLLGLGTDGQGNKIDAMKVNVGGEDITMTEFIKRAKTGKLSKEQIASGTSAFAEAAGKTSAVKNEQLRQKYEAQRDTETGKAIKGSLDAYNSDAANPTDLDEGKTIEFVQAVQEENEARRRRGAGELDFSNSSDLEVINKIAQEKAGGQDLEGLVSVFKGSAENMEQVSGGGTDLKSMALLIGNAIKGALNETLELLKAQIGELSKAAGSLTTSSKELAEAAKNV